MYSILFNFKTKICIPDHLMPDCKTEIYVPNQGIYKSSFCVKIFV